MTEPAPAPIRIAFAASDRPEAQAARERLIARYGSADPADAQVIVALGGDGFMLQTLHETQSLGLPVYGMNCGTIGFLMNAYAEDRLEARLDYETNLRSEAQIASLHDKIDLLLAMAGGVLFVQVAWMLTSL